MKEELRRKKEQFFSFKMFPFLQLITTNFFYKLLKQNNDHFKFKKNMCLGTISKYIRFDIPLFLW